jgi:hypothetical protein
MGTDVEASRADDEERVRIAWHILTALHAAGFSAELVVADDPAIEVVPLIPRLGDWFQRERGAPSGSWASSCRSVIERAGLR